MRITAKVNLSDQAKGFFNDLKGPEGTSISFENGEFKMEATPPEGVSLQHPVINGVLSDIVGALIMLNATEIHYTA